MYTYIEMYMYAVWVWKEQQRQRQEKDRIIGKRQKFTKAPSGPEKRRFYKRHFLENDNNEETDNIKTTPRGRRQRSQKVTAYKTTDL